MQTFVCAYSYVNAGNDNELTFITCEKLNVIKKKGCLINIDCENDENRLICKICGSYSLIM